MIIVTNSLIAKAIKVNGIVLYPFIFFSDKTPDKVLINHEMIHVSQIKRDGLLRFYGNYLKEYFIFRLSKMNHQQAYRSISYEIEAYDNQEKKDYLA